MKLHHNGIIRFGCKPNENLTIMAMGGDDVGKRTFLFLTVFFMPSEIGAWEFRNALINQLFSPRTVRFRAIAAAARGLLLLLSHQQCWSSKNKIIDQRSKIRVQIAKLPAGKTFMEFVLSTGVYDMAESNGFENVIELEYINWMDRRLKNRGVLSWQMSCSSRFILCDSVLPIIQRI